MIIFIIAAMIGAVARYLVDLYLPKHGILLINILGSCAAGSLLVFTVVFQFDEHIAKALVGGFAGSLTTYSTVAVVAAQHHHNGTGSAWKTWSVQVGASVAACLSGIGIALLLIA
ncbi:fluoride efflux transporter FluC [Yaniella halotolerans]|uniref:fluoride efflux transporter FluC n=1 Tax=Yaniella halotolerans TaxID=225453 RepID=UPI0003B2F340|nr:CrcB family protein [Yaniella halotolerans]